MDPNTIMLLVSVRSPSISLECFIVFWKVNVKCPYLYHIHVCYVAQTLRKCCRTRVGIFGGSYMHPTSFLRIPSNVASCEAKWIIFVTRAKFCYIFFGYFVHWFLSNKEVGWGSKRCWGQWQCTYSGGLLYSMNSCFPSFNNILL